MENNNLIEMYGWVIALIVIFCILAVIILMVFRIYYQTHSIEKEREIKQKKPVVNPDEIKRRETFRERLRSFLQKY